MVEGKTRNKLSFGSHLFSLRSGKKSKEKVEYWEVSEPWGKNSVAAPWPHAKKRDKDHQFLKGASGNQISFQTEKEVNDHSPPGLSRKRSGTCPADITEKQKILSYLFGPDVDPNDSLKKKRNSLEIEKSKNKKKKQSQFDWKQEPSKRRWFF